MGDDEALASATKQCIQCGEEIELLRFRCPRCSSEMFLMVPPDPELEEVANGRQKLSQQHTDRGARLFQQGLADEAIQEFEQAIEANPWNATTHANIGVVSLRRGKQREALQCFERALEIDPHVAGVKEMADQVRSQLR